MKQATVTQIEKIWLSNKEAQAYLGVAWTFSKTFVQADVSRSSRSAQRCSTANATSISSSRKIEYVRVNSTFIMFLKSFVSAIF